MLEKENPAEAGSKTLAGGLNSDATHGSGHPGELTGSVVSTGLAGSYEAPYDGPAMAAALSEVRAWFGRFISVTNPADLDLLTLWTAHTYVASETYTPPGWCSTP